MTLRKAHARSTSEPNQKNVSEFGRAETAVVAEIQKAEIVVSETELRQPPFGCGWSISSIGSVEDQGRLNG